MSARMPGPETERMGEDGQGRQAGESIWRGEEMRRLMADVEDLIKKVAHVSDADIARVRDRAQQTLISTRRQIQEGAAKVRANGQHLAETTDSYVHERPWTALGIAAAVGVIIGLIASGSTRR